MSLQVYNSLSRQKENFEPHEPGKVKMYCCGPTVYDFLHIGNFRGPVVYNFLCNWLETSGYDVTYVYNFTDVDDKIIRRASEEGVEAGEVSERFIEEFWKDFNALKLRHHDHNPKVTEHMDGIIAMIQRLIDNGKAYAADGEVYFHVESFDEYGQLSHRQVEDLLQGVRIDVDPKKKAPADFTLWKPAKPDELSWSSPWGEGRPGWHIECSCMSDALLGPQIDIHGGGSDLIFPHHENEIAQSEGASEKSPYVKYWIHNNMINFSGAKMSKSLGNVRTMRSFLEDYHGEIFKYLVLASHYRSECDFSPNTIQLSVAGLARVYSALKKSQTFIGEAINDSLPGIKARQERLQDQRAQVEQSWNDDFNTAKSFAVMFEVIREMNSLLQKKGKRTAEDKGALALMHQWVLDFGKPMSLFQEPAEAFLKQLDELLIQQKGIDASKVDQLIDERAQARQNKDYQRADEIRQELTQIGVEIHDAPDQTTWEVIK